MNTKPFVDFVNEQWKLLLGIVAALLVVVAIAGVWSSYKSKRELQATSMLYELQAGVRAAVIQKKYEEAAAAYKPLLEKYSGSRVAFEAELQIGDLWMEAGNFPRAIEHFEKAVKLASDPFSQLLSHYTLGVAKESAGKYQEAVADYEAALQGKGADSLRPELLMAQARCYEALNQPAKAIEIYKTVQEKFATRSYYSGAASAYEKQLSATTQAKSL